MSTEPKIEITDEIVRAFEDAAWDDPVEFGGVEMANNRAGLAAVIAIIERDHRVLQKRFPITCHNCGSASSDPWMLRVDICCRFDRIQPFAGSSRLTSAPMTARQAHTEETPDGDMPHLPA